MNWNQTVTSGITSVVLCASLALNVGLALKTQQMRGAISELKNAGRLQPGTQLQPLVGKTPQGEPLQVNYGDTALPTVLYVFTPTCPWCARNVDNINRLVALSEGRFRFVGISLTPADLVRNITETGYRFPVITELPATLVEAYRLGGTPQTMIVDSSGKLVKNWVGAYQHSTGDEIERHFDVELPGMRPTASEAAAAASDGAAASRGHS